MFLRDGAFIRGREDREREREKEREGGREGAREYTGAHLRPRAAFILLSPAIRSHKLRHVERRNSKSGSAEFIRPRHVASRLASRERKYVSLLLLLLLLLLLST
jgi:hypothetical protein